MLLVRTKLGRSAIHGIGVMADEPVRSGQPIWRFAPGIDLVLPDREVAALPTAFRAYLDTYGYRSPGFEASVVLSCDHAKFLNHSEHPNTVLSGRETLAGRHIEAGQEITCDYRLVVDGWTGFG